MATTMMAATARPEQPPKQQLETSSSTSSSSSSSSCGVVSTWSRFTEMLHSAIQHFVLSVSLTAARNPKRCIALVSLLSISLMGTGLATNFVMKSDDEKIFAPTRCLPRKHSAWIEETFPAILRPLILIVHANGGNVMTQEAMQRLFDVTDMVRQMDGFEAICHGVHGDQDDCAIRGPTRFWDHNETLFQQQIANATNGDEVVMQTLSQATLEGGTPFGHNLYIGNLQRDEAQNNAITYAASFLNFITLPTWPNGETEEYEVQMLDMLQPIREAWAQGGDKQPYRLEIYTYRSLPDEFTRATLKDFPLIPFVFLIMSSFTCLVFWRRDVVQSRALVGLGSVVTIMLSITSGFGLAFIIGLPFVSMTTILPFVIFGIGLDDTFIIMGAYLRTDPRKEPVERIRETMQDVGMSISLTTITTTVAFIIGATTSSIPVVQWLCLYAFPTIVIDFVYQISFFVSIVVLDEERIKANRADCCFCMIADSQSQTKEYDEENEESVATDTSSPDDNFFKPSAADRVMVWYSEFLMRPAVKVTVLVVFATLLGLFSYSATFLEQKFQPIDFLPANSYAVNFLDAMESYTKRKLGVNAFFRNVDQSDPEVQQQMIDYINDISDLPQIQTQPELCWVVDFQQLRNGGNPAFEKFAHVFQAAENMTFNQQLDLILSVPEINEVYGRDIVRNETGDIIASRCSFTVNYVDLDVVKEQVDFLADQREVTQLQPINDGADQNEPFFSFDLVFFIWEFYTVAVKELAVTTVAGVASVTFLSMLLVPHWSASLIIMPTMMVLYVELLGVIQFAGLNINPLTYICLVISVGLLVDFIMHILLRYYESEKQSREEKVKDALQTMGASILVGGLSTCLGVVPLAFSSSGIIQTVFVMFIAMVTLGVSHGLILLPVILSYVGPTACIKKDMNTLESLPSATSESTCDDGHQVPPYHRARTTTAATEEGSMVSVRKLVQGEFINADACTDVALLKSPYESNKEDDDESLQEHDDNLRNSSFGTEYSV